jgi:DNA phosphorothioation-associated putative methyltransferase
MDLQSHRVLVGAITYGKQLPDAKYIFRPRRQDVCLSLWEMICRADVAARPDPSWNLLKVHTDQVALTFLTYPDFETDPHPALAEATKINLNSGSVTRTDYRNRANPPILHRKETFLPADDDRMFTFAALTKQEEEAGLYRDSSRIGLRMQWVTLIRHLNLSYEGHRLISLRRHISELNSANGESPQVMRHRTAIKRYDLSKPVKQLLERGLLRKDETFFDYGCGHGMDVEALQNLGYQASGWDPIFRPNAPKIAAAVVNLGYVLNVIEEPAERIATLREAYSLTKRLLLVSTMVWGQEKDAHTRAFRDGFLTKTNTFQKFYAPGELEELIEQTLGTQVITLGIGVCVVFRDQSEAELFEAGRNRRRIDWTEISAQLRFSIGGARHRRHVDRYELHKELFDELWQTMLDLGRAPEPGEFDRLSDVRVAAGGLNKAAALVVARNGKELWQIARKARTEDLVVYLAMTNFRERFLRRDIPPRIKNDIRGFFGDLKTAQAKARDLLFAAGDPDELELALNELNYGVFDRGEMHFTFHRSLLPKLPPILRVYVGCGSVRYGNPEEADLIKIHVRSGKLTFLHYDDFIGKPLPNLQTRIKINMRTRFVQVFDHSQEGQLLYFKERYLAIDHPEAGGMRKFSDKVRKIGVCESMRFGPSNEEFLALARSRGLNASLNKTRRRDKSQISAARKQDKSVPLIVDQFE